MAIVIAVNHWREVQLVHLFHIPPNGREAREPPSARREIRLDKNLDSLFAGVKLDTNRRVAKINLMASSVGSGNNGVGHYSSSCTCCDTADPSRARSERRAT